MKRLPLALILAAALTSPAPAIATVVRSGPVRPHPLTAAAPRIAAAARRSADLAAKRRAVPRRPLTYLGTFRTTAYSFARFDSGAGSSDWCANGMRVGVGKVAVDPREIHLGTRLVIEGYNGGRECIAADTGGAIKGHRIDVFLPTASAMDRWGTRTCRVWEVEE